MEDTNKVSSEWKETEIGKIPKEWEEVELKKIVTFLDNKRKPLGSRERIDFKGEYPYYGASGIVDYVKGFVFNGEYLLISEDGENLRSRKTPIAFKAKGKFWVNNHAHIIDENEEGVLDYLEYYFLNLNINPYITGAVQPKLNKGNLERIKIKLPNKEERLKINKILNGLTSKIELNNQMNKTLEEMAQTIFKEWFVEFNFPNEDGVPYKKNGGEMVDSELGEIPKGWRVGTLEEVVELIIDHRGKTPKKLGGDWVEKGIQAISAKHIKNLNLIKPEGMNQADKKMYEKWMKEKLKAKDILMTSEAPLGELYFLAEKKDYILSQRIYGIRANEEIIFSEILFYFLQSELTMGDILSRATGSTVQGIKQTELKKVKIMIPEIKVQEEAVKILRNILIKNFKNKEENQTLINTRDTLLPKLMSGEVRL